jgi:hypothetical protein
MRAQERSGTARVPAGRCGRFEVWHQGKGSPLRFAILKTLLAIVSIWPLLACASESVATVTLLEGAGALLRASYRYALAEGVRLEAGDVLELSDKALLQVEFNDGTLAALGPRTRLMVLSYPASARIRGGGELFLLSGWLKTSQSRPASRVITRLSTALVEIEVEKATVVVFAAADESAVFVESGEARIAQIVRSGSAAETTRMKAGQFFSRKGDQRGVVAPRPAHAFVDAMPRSFMDTLPSRLAKFKERAVAPRRGADFTYAEVEVWINSAPPVRRALVTRWHAKAAEPAFRSALAANLKDHPEWDRVLNPEKYQNTPGSWGAKPATESQ